MIKPDRIIRGPDQNGPVQVWVFRRDTLGLNGTVITGPGFKTDNIFAAGVVNWSLYFLLAGGGTVTVNVIPMDEDDNLETGFQLQLGTNIAAGWRTVAIPGTFVVSSYKLQFVSTGSNTATGALLGRTA